MCLEVPLGGLKEARRFSGRPLRFTGPNPRCNRTLGKCSPQRTVGESVEPNRYAAVQQSGSEVSTTNTFDLVTGSSASGRPFDEFIRKSGAPGPL